MQGNKDFHPFCARIKRRRRFYIWRAEFNLILSPFDSHRFSILHVNRQFYFQSVSKKSAF